MQHTKDYSLSQPQDEFFIWDHDFKKYCDSAAENIREICYYGFTEIVNNAFEHFKRLRK